MKMLAKKIMNARQNDISSDCYPCAMDIKEALFEGKKT